MAAPARHKSVSRNGTSAQRFVVPDRGGEGGEKPASAAFRRLSPLGGGARRICGFVLFKRNGRTSQNRCKAGAETCRSSASVRVCPHLSAWLWGGEMLKAWTPYAPGFGVVRLFPPFFGRGRFANPTPDERRTEPARMVHLAHISSRQLTLARISSDTPPVAGVQGFRVQSRALERNYFYGHGGGEWIIAALRTAGGMATYWQ
jgi:hypothetical protein